VIDGADALAVRQWRMRPSRTELSEGAWPRMSVADEPATLHSEALLSNQFRCERLHYFAAFAKECGHVQIVLLQDCCGHAFESDDFSVASRRLRRW